MRKVFLGIAFFVFCSNLLWAQNPKLKALEVEADTLLNRQDFQGALKLYTKIISNSKPKNQPVETLYKRAICYYSLGEFENALKDLNIFIPSFPGSSQAYLLRAFVYREIGDTEHQLIDLEEVINSRPGDPELLKWRATLYIDKGEYLLGKRDILEVLKFQPDPEAETYLGLAYYNLNQPDSALISLNKAIELDVNYLPAYFYAGSFCLQESEYDLALKYINLVLRLDPKNPTALFYKGVALIEKSNIDAGCGCLNKAFYLGIDDAGDYLKEYCYEVED
jgi:tetratricopeptide (TPR) repeat protein